jgi:hypothetical protein
VDHGWVVRRPTDHGMITSVEFYDAQGKQIVNFFSRRDRGQPDDAVAQHGERHCRAAELVPQATEQLHSTLHEGNIAISPPKPWRNGHKPREIRRRSPVRVDPLTFRRTLASSRI